MRTDIFRVDEAQRNVENVWTFRGARKVAKNDFVPHVFTVPQGVLHRKLRLGEVEAGTMLRLWRISSGEVVRITAKKGRSILPQAPEPQKVYAVRIAPNGPLVPVEIAGPPTQAVRDPGKVEVWVPVRRAGRSDSQEILVPRSALVEGPSFGRPA